MVVCLPVYLSFRLGAKNKRWERTIRLMCVRCRGFTNDDLCVCVCVGKWEIVLPHISYSWVLEGGSVKLN